MPKAITLDSQVESRQPFAQQSPVEQVFEAFLSPPFDTGSVDTGYPQMLARIVVGDDLDQQLIHDHYNECAKRFIEALSGLLPKVDSYRIAQCYLVAIGAMITAFTGTDRAAALSGRPDSPKETTHETIARLVCFCAAGTRAFQIDQSAVESKFREEIRK